MKYAILIYDGPSSWQGHATEQNRALHSEYHTLASAPGIIAHYRLGSPKKTTTVRVNEEGVVRSEGPLDSRENLRALYLLESDYHDSVLEFAAQIPAARMEEAVEVCPLTER